MIHLLDFVLHIDYQVDKGGRMPFLIPIHGQDIFTFDAIGGKSIPTIIQIHLKTGHLDLCIKKETGDTFCNHANGINVSDIAQGENWTFSHFLDTDRYQIYLKMDNGSSQAEGWLQVDNAIELFDHEVQYFDTNEIIGSKMQIMPYIFVACAPHSSYGASTFNFEVTLNGTPNDGILIYMSNQHKYPTPATCKNDSLKEICGVKSLKGQQLEEGTIYRIMVQYSGPGIYNSTVAYTPFVSYKPNGTAIDVWIPRSKHCHVFIQMDLQELLNHVSFTKYAISVNHHIPTKEGEVSIQVAMKNVFQMSADLFNEDGILNIPQDYLEQNGCKKGSPCPTYLKINQKNALDYSSLDDQLFKQHTGGDFVAGINLDFQQQADLFLSQKFPKLFNDENPVQVENSIQRNGYNFNSHHDWVVIRDKNNKQLPLNLSYAFSYFFDATKFKEPPVLNLYVDWESFPSESNQMNSKQETIVFGAWHEAFHLIPAHWENASNDNSVTIGENMFSAGQLIASSDLEDAFQQVDLNSIAGSVSDVPVHAIATFTHDKVKKNTYFFSRIPLKNSPDRLAVIAAGGLYFTATATGCSSGVTLYTSKRNPLPNRLVYSEKSHSGLLAELMVNYTDSDEDMYVSINADQQCDVTIQVMLMNEKQIKVAEGTELKELDLEANKSKNYIITVGGNIYSKQNSYFKLRRLSNVKAEDYSLEFALTRFPYIGDVKDAPAEITILKGSLNYAFSESQIDRKFLNQGLNQLYLTVTRRQTNDQSASEKAPFMFQLGSATAIKNDDTRRGQFMEHSQAPIMYHMKLGFQDQYRFNFTHSIPNVDVYICKNLVPFISELSGKLCTSIKDTNSIDVNRSHPAFAAGDVYVVFNPKNVVPVNSTLVVTLEIDRFVQFGTQDLAKVGGAASTYVAIPLGNQNGVFETLFAQLEKCQNCAICFNFDRHLRLVASNVTEKCQSQDRRYMVGFLQMESELKPADRTFKMSEFIPISQNHKVVYATIVSLNPEGVSENVLFAVDTLRGTTNEKKEPSNIGWVEGGIFAQENNTWYQSRINYHYVIGCTTERPDFISVEVHPDIAGDKSAINYIMAHYSVYTSLDYPIPNELNSNWSTTNMIGMSVITIDSKTFFKQCENKSTVDFYVSVRAAPQMKDCGVKYFKTLTEVSITDDTLRRMRFGVENRVGKVSLGKRALYHFNVMSLPTQFVMSPCQGMPQMRVGVTNYYMRSIGNNDTVVDKKENVWSSYTAIDNYTFGYDIVFTAFASAKFNSRGDYIVEMADMRSGSGFTWDADIYVAPTDPRPGTPIRAIKVGSKQNEIQIEFKPAIPLGKNSGQDNMEYRMYILSDYSRIDVTYGFNPNTACGYYSGGISLMDEWVSPSFDFTMRLTGSASKFAEYAELNKGTKDFFVTVIARQKDTGMMRSYHYANINIDNMPKPLDSIVNETQTTTIIIVSVVISVVIVAIVVGLGIYFWRKKQAANPYQFAVEH